MPDEVTPNTDAPTLFDPESLREREDVEFLEATNVHDDRDHCASDVEGRAVVGVTNDDGDVLVIVNDERAFATLPNGKVESGDDWAEVGRERVEHLTSLPVEIDGVERVRRVEHFTEGENEPHTTSHQVVFSASPATDDPSISHGCDWRGEWCDELPEQAPDEGPARDDIRLFAD